MIIRISGCWSKFFLCMLIFYLFNHTQHTYIHTLLCTIERVNVTELNAMVPNPIYEGGGAIYEEIPGDTPNFRSIFTENSESAVVVEKEEGYVSMSNSNWDFPALTKYQVSSDNAVCACVLLYCLL